MNTEQEQVEEITSIIDSDICDKDCPNRCPYCGGLSSREAEAIYDAGYRKVDDVRKETAKEILNDLYFNLKSSVQDKVAKSNDYYNVAGWVEEIAKEYGVEVEE